MPETLVRHHESARYRNEVPRPFEVAQDRPSLAEACIAAGLIPAPRPVPAPSRPAPTLYRPSLPVVERHPIEGRGSVYLLLRLAYQRECFICGGLGDCHHREPQVELAMIWAGLPKVRSAYA
jgi:hypothetical protein